MEEPGHCGGDRIEELPSWNRVISTANIHADLRGWPETLILRTIASVGIVHRVRSRCGGPGCILQCAQNPFTEWTENSCMVNASCAHSRDQSRTFRNRFTQGWRDDPLRSVQECGVPQLQVASECCETLS